LSIDTAIIVLGVLMLVGSIIGGGIIYAGLEKVAEAIKGQQ
jgi:hypothetical protein